MKQATKYDIRMYDGLKLTYLNYDNIDALLHIQNIRNNVGINSVNRYAS